MSSFEQIARALTIADDARIMMRWWWFGPSITREEVTRQLTLMQQAGIGGVEVSCIYPVCLEGEVEGVTNQRYLSEAFCDVLGFAAREAHRLNLGFDVTLGSGWPFGGPHISEEHAARQLKTQVIDIPAGCAAIDRPVLGKHEILLAVADENGRALTLDEKQIFIDHPTSHAIMLIDTLTGQEVKRAAVGAEGLVLDHYRQASLQVHLEAVGKVLLRAAGTEHVRAFFTDSLEVYESNWTPQLLSEFKRRRGYDLTEHLPLLASATAREANSSILQDNDPQKEQLIHDLQHDYAQTLTELLEDQFLRPLQQFAHEQGVLSRVQAYGVPPASLSSYRYVDLPEGEATLGSSTIQQPAEWTEITPNRIASSASRFKSHNLVSGETWTRLHSPPYAATPLDMKAEADQFFLQGINQIMGHGWCHRPSHGDPTQWVFYAAGNFNEANPWHPVMPELSRYLQTVSSLLRTGRPVVDMAIYLPDHDVWARQSLSSSKTNLHHVNALREHIGLELPAELLRMGFNFDLVDDEVLTQLSTAADKRYQAIILPHIERIPAATLQALHQLAVDGVKIISVGRTANQPVGYSARMHEAGAAAQGSYALFHSGSLPNVHHCQADQLREILKWCTPDVTLTQDKAIVGYVHRRMNDVDLYFFANTANHRVTVDIQFREPGRYLYRLNLMQQTLEPVSTSSLILDAFESTAYLHCPGPLPRQRWGDFELIPTSSPRITQQQDISDNWQLILPDGQMREIGRLLLWTGLNEFHAYSGSMVYRRAFTISHIPVAQRIKLKLDDAVAVAPHRLDPSRRNTGYIAFLDMPVKDAAQVYINGRYVSSLFCPPYEIDLTAYLKEGENTLELKVYNRLLNALSHQTHYDFTSVHERYGQRFNSIQDLAIMPVEPAGISGQAYLQYHELK